MRLWKYFFIGLLCKIFISPMLEVQSDLVCWLVTATFIIFIGILGYFDLKHWRGKSKAEQKGVSDD